MNKNVKRLTIVLLAMTPLMVILAFAQSKEEGQGQMHRVQRTQREMMLPDISDDQREGIKKLKLQFMQESLPLKNQLNENRAKYQTLSTAKNVDMKSIEKLVEEAGKIEVELKKKAARNHQEIRGLLTDDQRIVFDSQRGREFGLQARGMKNKKGRNREMSQRGQTRHLRYQKEQREHKENKDERK